MPIQEREYWNPHSGRYEPVGLYGTGTIGVSPGNIRNRTMGWATVFAFVFGCIGGFGGFAGALIGIGIGIVTGGLFGLAIHIVFRNVGNATRWVPKGTRMNAVKWVMIAIAGDFVVAAVLGKSSLVAPLFLPAVVIGAVLGVALKFREAYSSAGFVKRQEPIPLPRTAEEIARVSEQLQKR